MKPIMIITDPVVLTKERTITIYKQKVYEDIDSETYKYAEARPENPAQKTNAVQSDSSERLDGHLLARKVEFRDSKIRNRISTVLKNADEVTAADNGLVLEPTFVYNLVLDNEFKDALLGTLKTYIHRYLVSGALFDWYGQSLGSEQASFYRNELQELESAIVGMVTHPSIAKRPLQPFGPAQKIR